MIAEPTHVVPRSERKHVMKNLLRIVVISAILLIGSLGAALAYLSYPGMPSRSRFMTFDGYIALPRDGVLNVLDYLTLNGNTLFVTSESSGSLFKIALDPSNLPASTVAEMSGTGAAHGVALVPGQNWPSSHEARQTRLIFSTQTLSTNLEAFRSRTMPMPYSMCDRLDSCM